MSLIGKRDPPHKILYDYNFEPHEEDYHEQWPGEEDKTVYRFANLPWSMNIYVEWDPDLEFD